MTSSWTHVTLGDALTLQRGFDLPQDKRISGIFSIVSSSGTSGTHHEYKVLPPGIVTGRYGTIGNVFYIDKPFWPLNTTLWVKDFKGNDPRFLSYLLKTIDFSTYSDKAAVPGVNRNHLHTAQIILPPIPEQQSIAAILGSLDDKIDLNRRMNETLEAMARAIFKDWFVDFGPTRAKMEGRAPYLAQEIWDLFPDALDDEGKPVGWEFKPVGDFAELRGGKQLEKERISASGTIPVFGGAGIMGYTDNFNADGFVIAVGRVGAYCGQFFSYRGQAWINNNASWIRQRDESAGEWLYYALRHADIDTIKKGAAQPFVSNSDIANMPIIWPGHTIISALSKFLVPLMSKAANNHTEIDSLAQTRDLLLPKLMSGEIRVKDAEKAFGAVL